MKRSTIVDTGTGLSRKVFACLGLSGGAITTNGLPLAVRPQPETRRNVKDTDFVRMLENDAAPPPQIKRVEVSTETLPKKTGGAYGDLFCPAGG